ncbi:hypothetical protein KVR01_011796 [Diaporthe batatas]|uniref:uncharacterized protein n=1 Tax=Diaporthe batatas TaxID=748121 RepID=UPI001D04FACE|nr:uncharacterized protein KVR01_011796 [Diaporthe batatas]KAG8158674.1 hypothetical protein KVR01_011796 [Diaporthe batatas]
MASAEDALGTGQLRQELSGLQILLIVLSALIGAGIYMTDVDALQLIGPLGLLVAFMILSVIAACIGDTVSHLVQLFPTPNAVFEYVYNFVDHELGWVVGFSYWYAWVTTFALEMLTAASITQFWGLDHVGIGVIFYVAVPVFCIVINSINVKYFGWVETVGGLLKVLLIITMSVAFYAVAGKYGLGTGERTNISRGFQPNENYTKDAGTAFCMALPLVAWSFGGIESTTMAAFEAKTIGDIALASRSIHWILIVLHFFYIIGMMFTIPWDVSDVASFHPWVNITQATADPASLLFNTFNSADECNKSTIGVVRAICNINRPPGGPPNADVSGLANFVNVVLLYSVLSCGNAALYIASRILYGLASSERVKRKGVANPLLRYLGSTRGRGVPFYAVVFSWLIFCWAPFLGFVHGGDWEILANLRQFLFVTSSMAYIVVWAGLCLAFIRFRSWCNYCAVGLRNLDGDSRRHYRDYVSKGRIVTKGILPQPLAAWIGLLGCFLLIIMSSSVWWNVLPSNRDVGGISKAWSVSVYFLEGILLALWAVLKAWNGNWTKPWWVPRDINPSDPEMLRDCIDNLNSASKKAAEREQDRDEPLEFVDWGNNGPLNGHPARMNSAITNIGPTERS